MERYLALKASAGSGKTFALTVRYISLLLLDIHPKEILSLTFTNKAAAEMSDRIYKTLFSLGEDTIILNAIVGQTNLTIENILSKKDEIINIFISSELSIYTIDKFVNKILREFSGYAGVSDDFNIEVDAQELLLYKFLISLDELQFNSLISYSHTQNKKLNSIVELFKILDEKNELLTTTKFNNEDLESVENNILEYANKIKYFIDNSSLSKSAKNAVDFDNIKALLSKGKTWLTKDILAEFTYFKKETIPHELEDIFQELKYNISKYYQLTEVKTLNHLFEIFNNFKDFRKQYNNNRNTLEFSDITNIVYELLQKHIDKEFLYFRLDSNYTSILIDEFQDTSVLQYKILEPLIEEIMSGSDEKFKTFFYVGDTKQSIYRFRGGTKELFDFVANKYDELKIDVLDTNYRSSRNVVEFVNNNFINLPNYEYYSQKVNSSISGYVEVVLFDIENENPYEIIAKQIKILLENGIDENNIAILTYTNVDVLNLYIYIKQQFPKLEITTEMTSKLIHEQNIQAVVNAIKYLYFKEDLYRTNFNALVGQEFLTLWTEEIDFMYISIPQLIKDIAITFNIMDQNTLKLCELSNVYDNIIDFIYEIDRLDASRVFKDKNGIQILTVFKSKGLEFDTVLVLDRIKKKNANRSSLLFEYEDIKLENIFLKTTGRQNFDQIYANAITKEEGLSIDDELNILYVSLTRAKNNMIIFKKPKNSTFDLLGETCKLQKLGELYKVAKAKYLKQPTVDVEYVPLVLGQQEKQIKSDDNSEVNIKARYFGIATHYCLEMMVNFDISSLDKSIDITKNKYSTILNTCDFDDMYLRIQRLLENDEFISLINNGEYFKEQSLIFDEKVKILDLLIKKDESYIICDYKTTTMQSDEHKNQVGMYQKAISNITNTNSIKSYVVYLMKDNIKIIEI